MLCCLGEWQAAEKRQDTREAKESEVLSRHAHHAMGGKSTGKVAEMNTTRRPHMAQEAGRQNGAGHRLYGVDERKKTHTEKGRIERA